MNFIPVGVKTKGVILWIHQVAMAGVVRDVFFEECDLMALASQPFTKSTSQRGMAISPRGAVRQTEYHQLHLVSLPSALSGSQPEHTFSGFETSMRGFPIAMYSRGSILDTS